MNDGTKLLVKVGEEYQSVVAIFGGFDTRLGRYISPHDIDEYAVLVDE